MRDRLLDQHATASQLALSKRSLIRFRAKLIARGLELVMVGDKVTFTESSINRLIRSSAENCEPLLGWTDSDLGPRTTLGRSRRGRKKACQGDLTGATQATAKSRTA
jgi:hypothetical protein